MSTSTTIGTEQYADQVLELIDEAEAFIDSQPETAANEYGYRTVASAYRGLAQALDEVTPPGTLQIRHGAVTAMAGMIADEATRISSLTDAIDRTGAGVGLAEHRRTLRETVEAFG